MKVAPSILTADFLRLEEELKSIKTADIFHIDIMDGHFVPNISFGPHITKLIDTFNQKLDIHLMVSDPLFWIEKFNFKNVYNLTFHFEADKNIKTIIDEIKKNGKKVGVSIKPNTNVDVLYPYIKDIDVILVMSVEPGFGGQKFIPTCLDKIKLLKEYREKNNLNYIIEVDGGVDNTNIELLKQAGCDLVVAGSYIFNQKDREKAINSLR